MIDLIFVGNLEREYLAGIVSKAETLVGKKIRYITYEPAEWATIAEKEVTSGKNLLLWEKTQ